jgi:hypothetical protein
VNPEVLGGEFDLNSADGNYIRSFSPLQINHQFTGYELLLCIGEILSEPLNSGSASSELRSCS